MARHILQCEKCKNYTMEESCSCGGKAISTRPPKYSPDDRYASYVREAKRKELVEKGLL